VAFFFAQSLAVLEVSGKFDRIARETFWAVVLPMTGAALVVGLALVMIETLNDFGTVEYFAALTLTLGILNVWIDTGGIEDAAQFASILLIFVMI
jgi:iron(III) transport system permease protein